jgi:hypothetical protein
VRQLISTPEQLQMAAMSVAARSALNPSDLVRLAYFADGDESLMEEALRPACEGGVCNIGAAEHLLSLRFLPEE